MPPPTSPSWASVHETLQEGSQSVPQQTLGHLCRRQEIWGHALRKQGDKFKADLYNEETSLSLIPGAPAFRAEESLGGGSH